MAYITSSTLGASLTASSSTALFALNQLIDGSDDSEWQYCMATGTLTTGMIVAIKAGGTAEVATTAILIAPGDGIGYSLGVTQFKMAQGEYGFVAKRGHNMIIYGTGSLLVTKVLYLGNTPGTVATGAGSATLAGIYITTQAEAAGLSTTARAILTYPRCCNVAATPLA